jgi:hypothetical protein
MDVLSCPGCKERFAVRGGGEGRGWRCSDCDAELRFSERIVSGGPLGIGPVSDWHLHYFPNPPDRYRHHDSQISP